MRIVILLLFVGLTTSVDQHATATVRLNKSFFQLASGKAKSIIDSLVPGIKIPNINVTTGNVHFWTRWINLTHFDIPRTTFSISKDGLAWNTVGGKIEIKVEMVIRYKTFPEGPRVTVVGNATTTVEDLRTNLNALIKTVNSRPEIVVNKCSTTVDKLDVVFNMEVEISDLVLSRIRPLILDYVKKFISGKACNFIGTLADNGNQIVRAQPEEIHIWRNIYLNYTASKNPIYHDDFIEADCSFRVAVNNKRTVHRELDDESLASSGLKSTNAIGSIATGDSRAFFNSFFAAFYLTSSLYALLYILAANGIFCILQCILKTVLRQSENIFLHATREKAYMNLAVVDQ